jgi:hypothetical protein
MKTAIWLGLIQNGKTQKMTRLHRSDIVIPRDIRQGERVVLPGLPTEKPAWFYVKHFEWMWDSVNNEWEVEILVIDFDADEDDSETREFTRYIDHALSNGWSAG